MTINIDVGSVQSSEKLHALIAKTFGFPDYYGNNWDAFDECIRDFPPTEPVHITGLQKLGSSLPGEAEQLKQCLQSFETENPGRRTVYVI